MKITVSEKSGKKIYRDNKNLKEAREQNASYGYSSRRTSSSLSRSDIRKVEREIGRIVSY